MIFYQSACTSHVFQYPEADLGLKLGGGVLSEGIIVIFIIFIGKLPAAGFSEELNFLT